MNITNLPEDIKTLTRSYAGLRSSDGRPHVSDDLLARMKNVSTEEAWGVCTPIIIVTSSSAALCRPTPEPSW